MKGGVIPRAAALAGCGGLFLALTFARVAPADAQAAQPLSLHWVRGEGAQTCIDGASLARDVEARLGRAVFGPAADAGAWLEGSVRARASGGFEASLQWADPTGLRDGSRALQSDDDDCAEISGAVALVVSVMIDPNTPTVPPERPDPEPEPVAEPAPEPPVEPAPAPPLEERAPRPRLNALGAAAHLWLGSLPDPQLGLGALYARDLPGAVRLRVQALAFGSRSLQIGSQQVGGVVHLQTLALGVHACPALFRRGIGTLSACAGGSGGLLLRQSSGLEGASDSPLGLLQLDAGLRGTVEWRRLRVSLGASFSVAVLRQRLTIADRAAGRTVDLYTQGSFGADLDLSVAVPF